MHSYQRDPQSGAGNCVCGAAERHARHPHEFTLPAYGGSNFCCCTQPEWAPCHTRVSAPRLEV